MLIAIWPLVFALVGVLLFGLATNPTIKESGRLMLFVGLFWLCYTLTGRALRLG